MLGGFQAGANWQTGRIVSGLEIDLSAGDIKGSASAVSIPSDRGFATATGTVTDTGHFDWLGSARARLGYLATPDLLLYGTGGLAWSRYETSASTLTNDIITPAFGGGFTSQSSSITTPSWRFGWVAGVGAEYRLFNSNWLARLEYLHYDFGDSGSYSGTLSFSPGLPSIRSSGDLTVDVVRAGLSYKFDADRFALGFPAGAGPATGLSYKAPPPVGVAWSWSGLYLGAHAGYGWGRDPFSNRGVVDIFGSAIGPAGFALNGVSSEGYVGGFQAGANWQSRSVVGGLELDISSTGIKGSSTITSAAGAVTTQTTQTDKFDPLGSVRTRIGYLVRPDTLLYGTGGLGWTRLQSGQFSTVTGTAPNISEVPNWLFGWVAGVGVETRLGNTNWLGRLEYLHYDFGNSGSVASFDATGAPLPGATSSGHLTVDVVRAGASYKFDWPGTVPAAGALQCLRSHAGQRARRGGLELERLLSRRSCRLRLGRKSVGDERALGRDPRERPAAAGGRRRAACAGLRRRLPGGRQLAIQPHRRRPRDRSLRFGAEGLVGGGRHRRIRPGPDRDADRPVRSARLGARPSRLSRHAGHLALWHRRSGLDAL